MEEVSLKPKEGTLRVTTYGGADTVTGSNFLVEGARGTVLIDCGIEQGRDYSEQETRMKFPYDVPSIDALIITHAHLDHIGRMPQLMQQGFQGKIYMTPPTRDIAEVILHDSVRILAGDSKYKGLPPLYTENEVNALFMRVETLNYREEKEVADGLSVMLRDTGHILGSASVRVKTTDGTGFAVTSDIGNSPALLLPDAEPIPDADVVLIESVYGDRQNPEKAHRSEKLQQVLSKAVARGGTILIPAFSIERTQLMLYEIGMLFAGGKVPEVPVFLDSPLAISVTDIYRKWGKEYFKEEMKEEIAHGHDVFQFPFLTTTRSREESEEIENVRGPKIIIAGAGMSHGGRIGKWEQKYLKDPKSTLIMVGYQAPGTPGRVMQDGAKMVKIDHQEVEVRAKIEVLHGWSGHADRDGLLAFAEKCLPRTKTFIVGIGEPSSARFLAQRIHDYLGVKAIVPTEAQSFTVTKSGVVK
jgi:metallo-beta-lactamase family protein